MIKQFENLTIEEVEFLVVAYDAFDYNFTQGYCSVEIEEDEFHSILDQLGREDGKRAS